MSLRFLFTGLCGALFVLAGCSGDPAPKLGPNGNGSGDGDGDGDDGSGNGDGDGDSEGDGDSKGDNLRAEIKELPKGLTVAMVTLSCDGDCAQVKAVASGGNPGYTYEWNDGVTTAEREICANDKFSVTVTDSAIDDSEFGYEAQTATAKVSASGVNCPAPSDAGAGCDEFIDKITPPILTNEPAFFAQGADLPAGRYSVKYEDGCIVYSPFNPIAWKLQGAETFEYWIIRNTVDEHLMFVPGDRKVYLGNFESCVSANKNTSPVQFDFAGGKLGIYLDDFMPGDNVGGPNGRNPSWSLTRLCSE